MSILENIKLYLEKSGWVKSSTNRAGIVVFIEPSIVNNNQAEIFLPINDNDKSAAQFIKEAIGILAFVNGTDLNLTSNTITKLDKDLINYRVNGQDNGSISVTFLEELLASSKDSLKYASRIEYANYFRRLDKDGMKRHLSPTKHLEQYLGSLSFAHTWKGSFGITIENPLELESLGLFALDDSIGRVTTKRLINDYNLINEATEIDSSNYLIDHLENRIDAKVISPYTSLLESIREASIDITFSLSPIIDVPEADRPKKPIVLNKKSLKILDRAMDQLNLDDDEIDIDFIGFPETMKSPMKGLLENSLIESDRHVTVRGTSKETGTAALKMILKLEEYRNAIKAQSQVKLVRVKCKVKKKAKGWEVISVRSFVLID